MYNRILTDKDRRTYQGIIDEMAAHSPEMIGRKISSALVQQAFVVNTIRELVPKGSDILSAGGYEDTAGELLKKEYTVINVDPVINMTLHQYRWVNPEFQVDAVISTSVLEHTVDDEEFIEDICALLKPGGIAVLTCDYKVDYRQGDRLPTTSNRFYTEMDLLDRLYLVLLRNNCEIYGDTDYSERDTFSWEGIPYSFATYVFRKDTI